MSEGITLRAACAADAGRLATLAGELGYPATAAEVERRLPPLLASPDHLLLVAAAADGAAVGWLHAVIRRQLEADPFVHVVAMVVAGERRGAGIGRRLLEQAERWALAAGVLVVRVRSNVVRQRAHAFYRRAGYTLTKTSHLFVKRIGGRLGDGAVDETGAK